MPLSASSKRNTDIATCDSLKDQAAVTTPISRKSVADEGIKSFPASVYCIIGNEFCERFCFYGMKAILPIYLTAWLHYTEDRSTTIIHAFNFSAYFFTLFGGIISDSWLGKFWTILSLSIIYCIGSIVLAVTAFPGATGTPPKAWGCFLGLALLALGTGGIKPCVSSFGGDQFRPAQAASIAVFFSAFYFAINAGSVLSMLITPIIRSDVHCYGQKSCYPMAFGLPAILMLVATLIFVAGYRLYRHVKPEGNVGLKIAHAGVHALKRRRREPAAADHWLDYAQPKFAPAFLSDCKALFKVLTVFMPICLFWALYDQQGSRWTYQAMMMNPTVRLHRLRFEIKPEQMGLVNAFLILAMIPFFDKCVYPLLRHMGCRMRPLNRMAWGMVLGALSFVMAAALQFAMVRRGRFVPDPSDPMSQICVSGCIHVLAQVPQYIVLTAGEILFSITGLEFAYSQAPASMKSVCQAGWLLTVALGNLVVIVLNELDPIKKICGKDSKQLQTWNFVMWTAILSIGIAAFAWLSYGYKYVGDGFEQVIIASDRESSDLEEETRPLL